MNARLLMCGGIAALCLAPAMAHAQGEIGVTMNQLNYLHLDTPGGDADGLAGEISLSVKPAAGPYRLRVDLGLAEVGDTSVFDGSVHGFYKADTWSLGVMAGSTDIEGAPQTFAYGLEGEHYGEAFTLSGGAFRLEPEGPGANATLLEAGASFYPSERLALRGRVGRLDSGAAEATLYGAEAEYGINNAISVFAGWDKADDVDSDLVSVGVRFIGGSGSVKGHDRNGGSSGPGRLFRLPF